MQGVTAALVGFIFVCVVFPNLIRNKPQFYAGLAMVLGSILCDAIGLSFGSAFRLMYFVAAGLQIGAILIFFLAAGGITWRALANDMGNAFEVIRRGESTKEVIIPLSGQKPKPKYNQEPAQERYDLEDSDIRIPNKPPAAPPSKGDDSLPMV